MSGPALTVPADSVADLHGFSSGVFRLPITNPGTVALRVSGSVAAITAKAKHHGAVSWVRVTSGQQTIQPGHQGVLVVAIHVPAAAKLSGARYVNVMAEAQPVSQSGQVQEGGGVGGTLRIVHPGHRALPAAPPAPIHPGNPWALWLALGAAVVVLAAVGIVWWVTRPNHRPSHADSWR